MAHIECQQWHLHLEHGRVTEEIAFTRTGLDYLGPMIIKTTEGQMKVWVCLFTCMVTRAIHLELLQDMSSEEFLLGFRRFVSQRGSPVEIISDNALQFKTARTVGRPLNLLCPIEVSENGKKQHVSSEQQQQQQQQQSITAKKESIRPSKRIAAKHAKIKIKQSLSDMEY